MGSVDPNTTAEPQKAFSKFDTPLHCVAVLPQPEKSTMNVKELIEILSELPPDFDVRADEFLVESVEVMRTSGGNWVWLS
jgi:hypothetical protein